jgi:hypothetical protein
MSVYRDCFVGHIYRGENASYTRDMRNRQRDETRRDERNMFFYIDFFAPAVSSSLCSYRGKINLWKD